MKCESSKNKILLAQSGELSRLGRLGLARHLLDCAACRQFELELRQTTHAFHGAPRTSDIRPAVLERIRVSAKKELPRRQGIYFRPSREPLIGLPHPAILCSALGVLLLSGFWFTIRPILNQSRKIAPRAVVTENWETANIDTKIEELSDQLDVAAAEEDMPTIDNEDVNSIARELLELEGQTI